jgi:hypothetical protein
MLLLLPLAARRCVVVVLLLVVHAVCWLWRQHVCYSFLLRRLCGV